jgi:hypothetical protein
MKTKWLYIIPWYLQLRTIKIEYVIIIILLLTQLLMFTTL